MMNLDPRGPMSMRSGEKVMEEIGHARPMVNFAEYLKTSSHTFCTVTQFVLISWQLIAVRDQWLYHSYRWSAILEGGYSLRSLMRPMTNSAEYLNISSYTLCTGHTTTANHVHG